MTFKNRVAGATALGIALLTGLPSIPAWAGYVVTLQQVGSDVLATGSGQLDLTGLTFLSAENNTDSFIFAASSSMVIGPGGQTHADDYTATAGIAGPGNFGTGDLMNAGNGAGDAVGLFAAEGLLFVPKGYASGAPLADNAIFNNQSFGSLGVTPGTYEWRWGTGQNQNFTLEIGTDLATPTPEPSSVALLGTAFIGLLLVSAIRRKDGSNAYRTSALP